MADQQTQDTSSDKPRSRQASDTRSSGGASAAGEARSFAQTSDALRPRNEFTEAAKDLSQAASEATREASVRGRQAALEVADNWRAMTEPFMSMHADINRWFDEMWRQASGFGVSAPLRRGHPFAAMSAAPLFGLPAVDMKETEATYVLHAELPGLTREDIDLEIRDGTLFLAGHKGEATDGHGAAYRISERRFGRFERAFPLPSQVDADRIKANFRDGVLTITLPKAAQAKADVSKIEIKP